MTRLLLTLIFTSLIASPAMASRNGKSISRKYYRMSNLVKLTLTPKIAGKSRLDRGRPESFCTGVRITRTKVLTVAHCFRNLDSKSFKVDYQNGKRTRTETLKVSDVVINSHELDRELAIFTIHPKNKSKDYLFEQQLYDYVSGEFDSSNTFLFAGYGYDHKGEIGNLRYGLLKFKMSKNIAEVAEEDEEEEITEEEEVPAEDEQDPEVADYELSVEEIAKEEITKEEIAKEEITKEEIAKEEKPAEVESISTPLKFEQLVLEPLKRNEDTIPRNQKFNQNPCEGDSGGPLYKKNDHGDLILVALISSIGGPLGSFKGKSSQQICKKADRAFYIPLSLHKAFLDENGVNF